MFKKSLTAGVLAASLALTSMTPSTAAAQISEEDALVGVITLLLLGAAIHNNRDNDVTHAPQPQTQVGRRILPAECLQSINTRRRGTIRLFTQRCMNREYRHVNLLPDNCLIQVHNTRGQVRRGYRQRCTRAAGFRASRH